MKLLKASLFFAFLLIVSFGFNVHTTYATASWYNASWGYRTKITIDHTKVASSTGSNLSYFPVLISTTTAILKDTGNGGHVGQTDGGDFVFTSTDGTTKLKHEIEKYTSSSGALIAWVQVPTLATSTDTDLYLYYGNASVADQWNTSGTWDDGGSNYFKGVWHLADPTNPTDSTGANNGTNSGSTATTGQIDGAGNFVAASNQYVSLPGTWGGASWTQTTVSAWVNTSSDNGNFNAIVASGNVNEFMHFQLYSTSAGSIAIYLNTGRAILFPTPTNNPSGTWRHIVVTTKSGESKVYINGVQSGSTDTTAYTNIASTANLSIGRGYLGGRQFNGIIDNVQISKTVRSADWIKTEYNNQNSPSTFETSAAEESVTAPGAPTGLTPTIGNNQVSLSWTTPVNNGGLAISDYVIDYKLTSDTSWSTFADGVSAGTSGTVTGLINGISYNFRVSAVNAVGQGSASSVATTSPATVPDAPTIGTATSSNAQASVTFTPITGSWYNNSWGYRKKITIDHTKVQSTNQLYFPVLINRTDNDFRSTGNGGHVGQTDGGDILFTSSDAVTKLSHEIEKYTSTTGEVVAWVKVPTLSTSVDTVLYMYYGNASVADQWNTSGTWNDGGSNYFKGVWHLADPTNPIDSTGVNNGTNSGTTATSSQIDGGAAFNGSSQYISLPPYVQNYPFSVSLWIKPTVRSGGILVGYKNDSNCCGIYFYGPTIIGIQGVRGSTQARGWNANLDTLIPTGSWTHIVATYTSASNNNLYINGVNYTKELGDGYAPFFNQSTIGRADFTGQSYFNGSVDNVQISSLVRSADWIKTEFNNQSSPSTFYSVTTEDAQASTPSNGGSAVTNYTVTSSPGGLTASSSTSPITVTGLTNGTAYTFTVTATNGVGTGPASSASNSVTPATVPDAPTAFSATPGNTQVALSWSAPAFNGGTSLTDYVVEYKLNTDVSWTIFSDGVSTATSTTITGLVNGTLYNFRVSAVNSIGQGSASSIVNSTPLTTPGAPIIGTATGGNAQASITFTAPSTPWYNSSWVYRKKITIDHTKVGNDTTDQSNFPVLVSLSGLSNINTAGSDIRFTTSDGSTELSREIESYSSGTLVSWVKIPTLSHTSDTVIYMYYGNSGATEPAAGATYGSQSVWNDGGSNYFKGVWHLKETGTNPTVNDSTANANNSTAQTWTPTTSGQIDGAGGFNGSQYINAPKINMGSTGTVSTWIKTTSSANQVVFQQAVTNTQSDYMWFYLENYNSPGGTPRMAIYVGSTGQSIQNQFSRGPALNDGSWHHLVWVGTGASYLMYVDGVLQTTNIYAYGSDNGKWYSDLNNANINQAVIGRNSRNGENNTYFNGSLDDVKISSTARSADWIKTEYNNQNSPSTFYSTASEETSANPTQDNGGSAITSYTVTSNPGSHVSASSTSPITVTGLTNGTAYTFTVTATNAAGTGPASSASNSVTPATIPDAPTSPVATAGNAQASIAFNAPSSNGGSAITSYTVTSSPGSFTASGASSPIIVTGLSNGTSYTFSVTATNAVGTSTASVASNSITPITVASAPIIGTSTPGNTQVLVAFSVPVSDGGSTITSYTAASSPGGFVGTGSGSPIVVAGLTNGTAYTFTVTATNAAGTSASSSASNSVTPATVPDAPTGLTPTAGNAQVELSWTAPVNNGGSAVTDYVIEYKLTATSTWSTFAEGVSAGTTGTVTGLANGSSYDFRVSAVNSAGQGAASTIANAIPVTIPDAPTSPVAVAGNAQATITFSAPAFNGGTAITLYTITSNPGNISTTTTTTSGTITGLTNGTAYTFTVTATNAVGTGSSSVASNSVTPMTVPGAPTGVTAIPGNHQATITFTAPVLDGGSAITSYTVASSPSGIASTSTGSPIIVTGLTNGTTYTFTVTATNSVGTGASSTPSNPVTLSTEPGQPVNLAATVTGSSIGLTWSAPSSTGGSAITDYVVEYQLTTGGSWSVFADGLSSNTTATVTGLSNNTSYDFRVSAVNIIGQSIPSNSVTATPGEPAQVLIQSFPDLTLLNIGTAVRITNEGSSDYEYQYTWCVTDSDANVCGGGDDIFSSTAAKLIHHGENYDFTATSTLSTPGNYWFHVKVNYGSQSSSASQSFTAVATYPDAPTSVIATSTASGQATISFSTPASNGSAITGYTVTSNPSGFNATGSVSPITVTGLSNGTSYTFTVVATNDVGTSPASSPPSNAVTPVSVPDAPTGVTATAGNTQVALSWTAPASDGGLAITDYVVEYKLSTDLSWTVFADGVSTLTSATVTGLTNDVSYDFRVSAVNALGQSAVNSTSAIPPSPVVVPPPTQGGGGGSSGNIPTYPPAPTPIQGVPQNIPQNVPQNASQPSTPSNNKPNTNVNIVPPKNEVSATPTEHPAAPVPTASETGGWSLKWILIDILVALIIVLGGGYLIFALRRRREEE